MKLIVRRSEKNWFSKSPCLPSVNQIRIQHLHQKTIFLNPFKNKSLVASKRHDEKTVCRSWVEPVWLDKLRPVMVIYILEICCYRRIVSRKFKSWLWEPIKSPHWISRFFSHVYFLIFSNRFSYEDSHKNRLNSNFKCKYLG